MCIYPNNKNLFTKDLKLCLNERKVAFIKGDKELERRIEISGGKLLVLHVNTKPKLKVNFLRVIQSMNVMMGKKGKKTNPTH